MAEKITRETCVGSAELAAVLGLTGRRIQQLAQDGVITSVGRKYPLAESVQSYIEYATRKKTPEGMEAERLAADTDIKKAKAVMMTLEAEELEGKMHRSEDVEFFFSDMVFTIRDALLSLPGRTAIDVAACETAAEASEVIRREVAKTLEDLAKYRYDPAKYRERVRERRAWDIDTADDEEQ